ncbi:MAG: TIGR02453 family protein [Bacteroidetes bacterium B1(2017)]|nr:MAG: TIGR02453 family protein [Bacteroidetes bacterium B1(2017)]
MDFKLLINFLKELQNNNSKEWFDQNRTEYEALRKNWITYVGKVIDGLQSFDPSLNGLEPKACIFRINKDIRFSKDKTPYKTNFGAIMNRGGKKSLFSGYYLHIDPKEIFIAGGAYQPTPEHLAALRQEIDYNYEEFKAIASNKIATKNFGTIGGEKLVRPPKGYELDNPAIEYLKQKSFIWVKNYSVKELYSPTFIEEILLSYKAMKPLNDFINRCAEN